MSIADRDVYVEENPHLRQIIGTPGFISQHGSTIGKAGSEWRDKLKEIKKKSGRGNTINV